MDAGEGIIGNGCLGHGRKCDGVSGVVSNSSSSLGENEMEITVPPDFQIISRVNFCGRK